VGACTGDAATAHPFKSKTRATHRNGVPRDDSHYIIHKIAMQCSYPA
jgi:hypothetical protein